MENFAQNDLSRIYPPFSRLEQRLILFGMQDVTNRYIRQNISGSPSGFKG